MALAHGRPAALVAAVLALTALPSGSAGAAPSHSSADLPCRDDEPVPVETLDAVAGGCDVTGRLVVGGGVGVYVPPRGQAASIYALNVDGEIVLQVP